MIENTQNEKEPHTVTEKELFRNSDDSFIHLSVDCPLYVGVVHQHEFVEISYVISGEAEHSIGGGTYRVRRGDVVIIKRNTPHAFCPIVSGEPFVAYDLMISKGFFGDEYSLKGELGDILSSLFYPGQDQSPDFHLSGLSYIAFGEMFSKIYAEFTEKQKGYRDLIRAYTVELLVKLFRKNAEDNGDNLSSRLRDAVTDTKNYIRTHFKEHITLDLLASRIFFSKDYLNRIFREVVGTPIGVYLQQKRLEEACRLLRDTNKTVVDIAEESGFGDVKSFYTVFKREMNVTPGEYRTEKEDR